MLSSMVSQDYPTLYRGGGGGYNRSLRVSDYMCCASTVAAPLHCHSGFLHYWYSSDSGIAPALSLALCLYCFLYYISLIIIQNVLKEFFQ